MRVLPSVGWRLLASSPDARMPVTLKVSKLFYDRFGEQVTNELVD